VLVYTGWGALHLCPNGYRFTARARAPGPHVELPGLAQGHLDVVAEAEEGGPVPVPAAAAQPAVRQEAVEEHPVPAAGVPGRDVYFMVLKVDILPGL